MRRVLAAGLFIVATILITTWWQMPESTTQPGSALGPRPQKGEEAQNWELALQNYPKGVVLPGDIYKDVLAWQQKDGQWPAMSYMKTSGREGAAYATSFAAMLLGADEGRLSIFNRKPPKLPE